MYQVAHVGLAVRDAAASSRFYQEVLGCREVSTCEREHVKLVFLQAGGQTLELVQHTDGRPTPRGAGVVDHIAFYVDDMAEAVARLRAHGVTLLQEAPRTAGDMEIMFFAGPDGERLEFVQQKR